MRLMAVSMILGCLLASCGGGTEPVPEQATSATAPDFTLALGNGGTFTLSEESRPVFMVFWAEW